MKLDLGVSVYSVPSQDINILLKFVLNNQFGAIELWDSPLPNKPIGGYKTIDEHDLNISIHAPLLNIGDIDSIGANTISLIKSIKRANRWKANKLILHTGIYHEEDKDSALATAKQVINNCIPVLESSNINLCIENVGYLGNDPINDYIQLNNLVNSFPEHLVGVVFDVSHANIVGGVKEGINILGNRVKEFHLSDNMGVIENHHLPLGKGNIDFNILKNSLILKDIVAILEIKPDENWKKNLFDSRLLLQKFKIID